MMRWLLAPVVWPSLAAGAPGAAAHVEPLAPPKRHHPPQLIFTLKLQLSKQAKLLPSWLLIVARLNRQTPPAGT
jgi:hypothetical protein